MDPIVTTALVGTARQEQAHYATGTPTDELIAGLTESENERKLLLGAGAWAVYRQAGQRAQRILALPEPAAVETLPACSPQAALLLSRLLNGEHTELLPEALTRLREVGQRLPHHVLPLALDRPTKELRPLLIPVLGERGRWLSQFNPAWKWVRDFLSDTTQALPADAETIWQEGSAGQRVEILRRLRAVDPAQGRTWIEEVWKQEKAEMRNDLLNALEIGLAADDEPLLEKALDDRAPSVRQTAAHLLTILPTSALVARMCERGNNLLKLVKGKLGLELPEILEKAWQRDGIVEKIAYRQVGERAWWLIQVLGAIPPAFWEKQWNKNPGELLAMLPNNEWQTNIVEGWSRAALNSRATHWLTPLWQWWQTYFERSKQKTVSDSSIREHILRAMPQDEAERASLALLQAEKNAWEASLLALPKPWSHDFARTYLSLVRASYEKLKKHPDKSNPHQNSWISSLSDAALALPPTCFAEAQQGWERLEEEGAPWQVRYLNTTVQTFATTMQIRHQIQKEIV